MRRSLLAFAAVSVFLAGAGLAAAQTSTSTTTTTTWSNDQAHAITEYSTTKHYTSFDDPTLRPDVGMVLPDTITLYPLPETLKIEDPDRYSYSIVNQHPVVVERTTRKVVHTWE